MDNWNPSSSQVSSAVWLVELVIFPYLAGFVMNLLGEWSTKLLRKGGNDAVKWATDPNEKPNTYGLSSDKKNLVKKHAAKLFQVETIDLRCYFYEIKSYVANCGGGAYELSTRALKIVNYTEAMLIPVPLLICLIGIRLLLLDTILGIVVIGLAVFASYSLRQRYLYIRGYWVLHVYRSFLAIVCEKEI